MASGYTKRLPVKPSGYISTLGNSPNVKELIQIEVQGIQETVAAVQNLGDGLIYQTAMQTKMGAISIKNTAIKYCPEKTGALKSTAQHYQVDVMESAAVGAMEWPKNVSRETFTFNQAQRMVWEVSFGGEATNGMNVDYAALIHENPDKWHIHTDINPDAIDHYLLKAFQEHEEYISQRIIARVRAQIARAAVPPAISSSGAKVRLVKKTPVYDDEVPF